MIKKILSWILCHWNEDDDNLCLFFGVKFHHFVMKTEFRKPGKKNTPDDNTWDSNLIFPSLLLETELQLPYNVPIA